MPSLPELLKTADLNDYETICQYIIERMGDVAFVVDLQLKILYVSSSVKRILGIDPEERINQEALTFLSPRSRRIVMETLQEEIRKEQEGADPDRTVVLDLEYSRKGGPWRSFEVSFRALRDRGGQLQAVLGLARERTEQQVTVEALRESERLWSQVISFLPDATMVINLEGRIIAWNQAMEVLTGVPAPEMVGQGDYAYALPFYGHRRPVMVDLVMKPEDEYVRRYVDVHWEGDRLISETFLPDFRGRGPAWFRNSASRLYDHRGNLIGAIETIREVTERKLAEEALKASEERYRDLVENSQDLICIHDLRGKLLSLNEAPAKILGFERRWLLNQNIRDLLDPKLRDLFEVYIQEIRTKGQAQGLVKVRTATGQHRYWEYKNTLRVDGIGEPVVRAMAQDITDRKRAEEALKASETAYRLLVENANEAIVVAQDGRLKYCNPMACRLSGYAEDQLKQFPFTEVIHPEDRGSVLEQGRRLLQEAKGTRHAFRLITRQNEIRWVEVNAVPIEWEGRPAVLNFLTDITERRRAEEALRESRKRYQAIFESSTDAVFVHHIAEDGKPGKFIEVNDKACRMLGYSREELLARHIRDIDAPESRVDVREKIKKLLSGRPVLFEQTHAAKDGRRIPVEVHAHIVDFEGRKAILSTVRDISERRRAEAERLELERRLLHAQKLESLGVLAGGIAHDFNNLLAAILGNLDLAILDLPHFSPLRPHIDEAVRAANRAADLTRQMLAYSGKGRFLIEDLDINALVRENTNMLKAAISKKVSLKLELGSDLPLLRADPGQIQQIIMNLITNGSEAVGDQNGVVSLTTGLQYGDEALLSQSRLTEKPAPGLFIYLEVADTGSGMDEPTRNRLFDPFFTTKFTGRGLGLSAVSGIVSAHRGAILVNSRPGQGTVIRVLLPTAGAVSTADREGVSLVGPPHSPSSSPADGLVLVVDDEEMIRSFCRNAIERLGYRVVTAADGMEAVDRFREKSAEMTCVLLDLTMPRMDGVAAYQQIKQIRPDVRVILSSGYSEQEAIKRFSDQGLSGFIQKPYSLASLEKILSQAAPITANLQPNKTV